MKQKRYQDHGALSQQHHQSFILNVDTTRSEADSPDLLTRKAAGAATITLFLMFSATAIFYSNRSPPTTVLSSNDGTRTAHVLLTGFQPFHDFPINPSEEVAVTLNNTCYQHPAPYAGEEDAAAGLEVCFESELLEVSNLGMVRAEEIIQNGRRYDIRLHLGLEDSAKGLKIEIAAANVAATEHNPAEACCVGSNCSSAAVDAPVHLAPIDMAMATGSVLPTTSLGSCPWESVLREYAQSEHLRSGVHELWSRDAGFYFCNELYYRSLRQIHALRLAGASADSSRQEGQKPPRGRMPSVLFIHLPDPAVAPLQEATSIVRDVAFALLSCDHGWGGEERRRASNGDGPGPTSHTSSPPAEPAGSNPQKVTRQSEIGS